MAVTPDMETYVRVSLHICEGCGRLFYRSANDSSLCSGCEHPVRVKPDLSLFPPRVKRTRFRRKP